MKRALSITAGVLVAAVSLLTFVTAAHADVPTSGVFYLRNGAYTTQCLDLANGNTADGTPIGKYNCLTGTNRQWGFEFIGNKCGSGSPTGNPPPSCVLTYRIHTAVNGKCLDIKNANISNGETVHEWSCLANAASQLWYTRQYSDGSYKFLSYKAFAEDIANPYALDAGPNYQVRIWQENEQTRVQHWFVQSTV